MSDIKFGVTEETKGSNNVNYEKGGFKRAFLTEVKREIVGKEGNTKYNVLSFNFLDHEGIKSFKHSEFELEANDPDFNKKLEGMNVRLKHLYQAFAPFPATGLGIGATSFIDFFDKVAIAFNTGGANNTPIYKTDKSSILVWLKLAYYNKKGNIGFALSPNFIEKIGSDNKGTPVNNQTEPRGLVMDNRYDKAEQPKPGTSNGAVMGAGATPGAIHTGNTDDGGF